MPITVYHLHVSSSERIVWLCEELGIDYELTTFHRAPILAPPEYKALHPAGTAPVIRDGSLVLAEAGACAEYISHRHGGGLLFLEPAHRDYADFLYWWHWVNGTFQPGIVRALALSSAGLTDGDSTIAALAKDRFGRALAAADARLRDNEWLAGEEITAADVMVVFSLTTMRYFYPYSLAEYPHILQYLQRVGKREAYQRAMKKCDPDMELVLGPDAPKGLL